MFKRQQIFALLLLLTCVTNCIFAPGSYPYAEIYNLKIKESDLIELIKEFKRSNPDRCIPDNVKLPNGMNVTVEDGRRNNDDHWYHVYFYYPEEDEIVHAWVREFDDKTTSFAFVSLNTGLTLGNWKQINKDFSRKENKSEKAKFEEQILNKIKLMIKS